LSDAKLEKTTGSGLESLDDEVETARVRLNLKPTHKAQGGIVWANSFSLISTGAWVPVLLSPYKVTTRQD